MSRGSFDAEGFFAALDSHRIDRGMTWRQVAKEAEISPSTLTRMAQGKRPDVDSLAALLAWSGESADGFILVEGSNAKSADSLAEVTAQFRRDPRLPPEAKRAIEITVKALYEQFATRRESK